MNGWLGDAPWVAPAPNTLPDLRARLVDYVRGPGAQASTVGALREGRGAISPRTGSLERDARLLLAEEATRLEAAELFYVDADMTRLAVAAAETLPVHQLHPTDVPAAAGFCVFAEPIATCLNEGGAYDGLPISIVAVSWGDSPMMGLTRSTGLWMTQWTPTDPDAVARQVHEQQGTPLARTRRLAQHAVGPLAWENEVTMTYGPMTELRTLRTDSHRTRSAQALDADTRGADIAGGTMHTGLIVRAAWLLMTQPGITDITTAALTRAERRRAQREDRATPTVRVVRIRHPENRPGPGDPDDLDSDDAERGRRYRVRWTVRGHWRRQWYPSRGDHRPVWINPHLKGPDGAPLHHTDIVHLLDTPSRDVRPSEPDIQDEPGPG